MRGKIAIAVALPIISTVSAAQPAPQQTDREMRLNVVVSSNGNLRNDGKGTYYTGTDFIAAWVNPTRWPHMSFDICMNWPFTRYPGVDSASAPPPSGTHDNRTLVHRMMNPVPGGGGKPLGEFTGPGGGNDVALPKPLTSTVTSFTDMRIGSSLSPTSAEVRFCDVDCTEYYSLIFGERSVFGYAKVHGVGTTQPIITRISETKWIINFPPRTIGRLWNRSGEGADLGLYYYEGNLDIQQQ
jgi:hypothetical protein